MIAKFINSKMGKIIIAANSQEENDLTQLKEKGRQNQVDDLQLLTWDEVKAKEGNNVSGKAGLFSPSTGIVNTHIVMKTLENKINKNNAPISYSSDVIKIEKVFDGYKITLKDGFKFISKDQS